MEERHTFADLSRRGFVGAAAASAGALAIGPSLFKNSLVPRAEASEDTESKDGVYACTHLGHCHGNCSLKVTVRNGRITLVEPNNWGGSLEETCCLKGISEIQHIYGPERIQQPLRRTGERGEGRFEAISWDEALDEVAGKLQATAKKYGGGSVLVIPCGEVLNGTTSYACLTGALGANTNIFRGIDTGVLNGILPGVSPDMSFFMSGAATATESNWKECDLVVIWGGNPLESTLNSTHLVMDAKRGGTKFVCVDPQFTRTAAKSDTWLPVRPGYDAELLLALSAYVVAGKRYDEGYLLTHTDLPFLVDAETGVPLREHEAASVDPAMTAAGLAAPETGEQNPFMVWDTATASPKPYNAKGAAPELDGIHKIEGKTYRTAFNLMAQHVEQYDLAWASAQTGVPEEAIADLAEQLLGARVKFLGFGFGGQDKRSNADVVGHAGVLLAALLGMIGGDSGGGFGMIDSYSMPLTVPLGQWQLPPEAMAPPTVPDPAHPDVRDPQNGIRAVFAAGDTLMMHFADMNRTKEWLRDLDFVAVADIYHSTGVDYADIVLPVCSKFEGEEEFNNLKGKRSRILLSQSAIGPLFESHTDFWIERELLTRMGLGDYYPKTFRELAEHMLAESPVPGVSDITLEQLVENHGIIALPYTRESTLYAMDYKFPTASGRVETYYPDYAPEGQGFPAQFEPIEVNVGNPLRERFPLTFMQPRTQFHLHNHFTDATWIRQFLEPAVELSPGDASERGIQTGDVVEVLNDRGSFKMKAQVNESIQPGSVRVYEGWWSKHHLEGNLQELTNPTRVTRGIMLPTGPIIPYFDTLVEVKKA